LSSSPDLLEEEIISIIRRMNYASQADIVLALKYRVPPDDIIKCLSTLVRKKKIKKMSVGTRDRPETMRIVYTTFD